MGPKMERGSQNAFDIVDADSREIAGIDVRQLGWNSNQVWEQVTHGLIEIIDAGFLHGGDRPC
jgi:hypothetical protein